MHEATEQQAEAANSKAARLVRRPNAAEQCSGIYLTLKGYGTTEPLRLCSAPDLRRLDGSCLMPISRTVRFEYRCERCKGTVHICAANER